jgi:arginyl-tRNA synthetase
VKDLLAQYLIEVLNDLGYSGHTPTVSRSLEEKFGDYTTNIAMQIGRSEKVNPIEIAAKIRDKIRPDALNLESVEVVKPGFINFFLKPGYFENDINEILAKGDKFGKKESYRTADIEWVSANPTGPLHAGHGRHIALGKAIAKLLEWNGYKVTREYYYNNAGRQMDILAKSVYARYRQLFDPEFTLPDDAYAGGYVIEIAKQIKEQYGNSLLEPADNLSVFKEIGERWCFNSIKNTLSRMGIVHDVFYNEDTLYKEGKIEKILSGFQRAGLSYEKTGATWLKTSQLLKDRKDAEDKVIVKSSGEPTYRLPDMAYHIEKIKAGYDLLVDIFGSDHADTYQEVLAGVSALGYDVSKIKVIIHQMVTFVQDGKPVRMSKRSDNVYYLDDLLDEFGPDVAQFFFVMRSANTHLDFDVKLAKDQSEKNPVFYLQYAHARICGILRNADEIMPGYREVKFDDHGKLNQPEELKLRKELSYFPDVIEEAGTTYEPHKVITYLNSVAEKFHKFYHNHRVINEDDEELSCMRLNLCRATQIVLKNGFDIIGISAPVRM